MIAFLARESIGPILISESCVQMEELYALDNESLHAIRCAFGLLRLFSAFLSFMQKSTHIIVYLW